MNFGVHVPELQLGEDDLRTALQLVGLAEGETYLELGSGEGRGLVLAAQEFGATAIGVEYLPHAVEASRARAREAGVQVDVHQTDLLQFDPALADVVFLHLGPAFHDLLAPRLEQLLRPTARVVTWGWEVPGWHALPDPDDFTLPCWTYQPGEPRLHLQWHDAGISRALPSSSQAVEAVACRTHADLHEIELRVEGAAAQVLSAAQLRDDLGRGEHSLVELTWSAAAPGVYGGALELWARSRQGRFTMRGAPLPVALQVTD